MANKFLLLAFLAFSAACLHAQDSIPKEITLWANGAPGSEGKAGVENMRVTDQGDHVITNVNNPTITPYFSSSGKNTGTAIIVIPGGGHSEIWITHEGYNPAKWFAAQGITCFVLKYRLAKAKNSNYTVDGDEVADLQRTIRLVKSRSAEWHIDTAKIGVMGFSAGGELAALSAMRFTAGNRGSPDLIGRQSDRPAFQVLMYPGNIGRFEVSKTSPPVFIAGGNDDRQDISEGMAQLYLKYKQAGVPAELHIYAKVGHGFGIRATNAGAVTAWPQEVMLWLKDIKMLPAD